MPASEGTPTYTPLEWTQDCETGLDAIDNDHKKLINLVNRLGNAVAVGKGDAVVGEVVRDLLEYTHYHFGREEVVMRRYHYPDFLPHKKLHDDFVRVVATARDRLNTGDGDDAVTVTLATYLQDWLVNHIRNIDCRVGTFVTAAMAREAEETVG